MPIGQALDAMATLAKHKMISILATNSLSLKYYKIVDKLLRREIRDEERRKQEKDKHSPLHKLLLAA